MKLRLVILTLALFALFSTVGGGYLYYRHIETSVHQEVKSELASDTESAKQHIEDLVAFYEGESRVLARFEQLQAVLLDRNQKTLAEANHVLDNFAAGQDLDVCYLLDESANTIASSNRNQPDSFIGHNYSSRSYFSDAMNRGSGIFFAVGLTSGKRGIFLSHAVYSSGRYEPVGVAVIKMSVDRLEREIVRETKGITLLTHDSGIIFVSSKPDWNLKLLWQKPAESFDEIAKTAQFGKGPWGWTGLEKKAGNRALDSSGEGYLIQDAALDNCPGWRIVNLYPLGEVSRRFLNSLFSRSGYIALFLSVMMGATIIFLYHMIQREILNRNSAEEALRQSEEKYRLFFDHSPLGLIHFDETGTITACNNNFVKIIGSSREKLIGLNTIREMKDRKMIASIREALSGNIGCYEDFYSSVTADKTTPVECTFGPVLAQDGRVVGGVGIFEDLTDRQRAHEALRESQEKFKDLFDNSVDLIYTTDPRGHYNSVNNAVETILEYTPEEFLEFNFRQIVDPAYVALMEQKLQMKTDMGADRPAPYEILAHTKSGRAIWLEIISRAIVQNGTLVGIHGTARDITDRKNAEEELNRLSTAVDQACEIIVITDSSGFIQYVNPSFETITGYKQQEVIGKTLSILDTAGHDKLVHEQMWSTLRRGEVWRGRFTNRKKDGSHYEETATISPVKDRAGNVINYVAVEREITTELLLQKQLLHSEKMKAIGTLAGGMAHDFNNLLQAIIGCTELLLMRKNPEDQDFQKLQVIRHAARDGADLVSRMLTFSRQVESKVRPVDLNLEIRRIEPLLARTLTKIVDVKLVLADKLDIIEADPTQLEQVVLNLAINARQAMPDGGQLLIETRNVSLRDEYLRTHLGAQSGNYVLLTVSDTGTGMPPEVLDRIFEPFFTTRTDGEGTGLGLATVHGIVAQHKAYIRCYSEPGMGTSFKIYFPVSSADFEHSPTASSQVLVFGSETILLVDDDERVRDMGTEMLSMMGYKVLNACSGEEALAIYTRSPEAIELIVLDLIMPGMGGRRCLEEILRIKPDAKVILASGYSWEGLAVGDKEIGAAGFVRKPYDTSDILTAIRKVLDRQEM